MFLSKIACHIKRFMQLWFNKLNTNDYLTMVFFKIFLFIKYQHQN